MGAASKPSSRREVVLGLAAGGVALGLPSTGAVANPARSRTGTAQKRAPIDLPPWTYGTGSSSTETVLMFRGNAARSFYGTGPLPETQPSVAWRFKTAGMRRRRGGAFIWWSGTGWTGSAVKVDDTVFFGSLGGYVYALDAETGEVAWQHQAPGMFKSSICVYQNRLYVGNTDQKLRCIDAATGAGVWTIDTGQHCDSSPVVVDGRLYIAGESGFVRALNPATGKHHWKTFVGGTKGKDHASHKGAESSPAIADGELYITTYAGELVSLDLGTGAIRWRARTYDDTDASPVVAGDFVYAAAEERAPRVYCFERETGKEVWRTRHRTGGHYSTPAVVGNRLWIGAEDGRLHCVDATDGTLIWAFETKGGIWSSPAVVDGKVVFGSRDYHLYCLDAATGSEVWKVRLDGRILSSPCIVDGTIWIGTATGFFYCLKA
ncbi:MAG: PQQ-binding-like beta-propeller repeat protein [Hyphomicrobiaceae bacterium]